MDLTEGEELALSLMEEHGLIEKGWTFRYDKATSRLGACHFHKMQISLSRLMVTYAEREDVEQTILHEIAHALLPPEVGHYKPWKVLAASIGYTGERTGRNPYIEAQLAGVADGPIAKRIRQEKEDLLRRREALLLAQKKAREAMDERLGRGKIKPAHIFTHIKNKIGTGVDKDKVAVSVAIGSTLILPGGDMGKIESKGRNVWRVRSTSNGKLYAVPFQHAHMVAA